MKNAFIVVALAVAVIIGVLAFRGNAPLDGFQPAGSSFTTERVEALLLEGATSEVQRDLYRVIAEDYPTEYAAFLADMTALANSGIPNLEQAAFEKSRDFTSELRRTNARYLSQAPLENLRAINRATLAVLVSLQDNLPLCAKFAVGGGANLTIADVGMLDLDLVAAIGNENFRAMAAGRDTPVTHAAVRDGDIAALIDGWNNDPATTLDMQTALMGGDMSHPAFCAANTTFQAFVAEATGAAEERAIVYMTTAVNAQ